MLGMETDEHLAEANVYVRELHNVLLLVQLTSCLLYFPQNWGSQPVLVWQQETPCRV